MKQPEVTMSSADEAFLLYTQGKRTVVVPVGSPSWYTWLEAATAFAFHDATDNFTAHKKRASNRRGKQYWYAYRRRHGKLFCVYLGASSNLTLERLRNALEQLALRSDALDREATVSSTVSTELPVSASKQTVTSFLFTRFSIPRLPLHYIVRPRLLSQLDRGVQERLTLVSAPAGSGKTTLLAAWARATDLPVAWLTLDAAENDPARFLSYLMAVLMRLDARIGEREALVAHESWEEALTRFVNDLARFLTRDSVLILDDYHLITAEPIHTMLSFLLSYAPPQLHLLIGTRFDPPLPLAGLRARGQLRELGVEELRFFSDELQAFFSAMDLDLSSDEQHSVERQTQGWIVGVQLLALALRGQTNPASLLRAQFGVHRFFLEYVSEEILALQPVEARRFLLYTSILGRLTGSLCEAVTGQEGGQARLSELYRTNLLLNALDDEGTWYSYHPLFAETLRAHLYKQEPDLVPELFLRASYWYEQHQDAEEACEYAFRSGNLPHAASMVAKFLTQLVALGRLERLRDWLRQIPSELIAASPQLCIASIWMQTWVNITGSSKDAQKIAEQVMQRFQQPHEGASSAWVELQSELTLLNALSAFSQNDLPRTIALIHEALYMLETRETDLSQLLSFRLRLILCMTYRTSGDLAAAEQHLLEICMPRPTEQYYSLNLIAVWLLADLYEAQGQLRKRGSLYEVIFRVVEMQPDLPPLALALLYMSKSILLCEQNRLSEALDVARRSLEIAHIADLPIFASLGLWTQVRIEMAQGNTEAAWQDLQQQQQSMTWAAEQVGAYTAISARLALACDRMEEALHWKELRGIRFDDVPGKSLESRHFFEYATLARVLIAQGRRERSGSSLSQALILLDHLRDYVVHMGFNGWLIEIQMLTALTLQVQGKTKQALSILGPALAQAESEGYIRLFADEGQPMAQLLAQVSAWTVASPNYIQQLLSAIPHGQRALPAPAPMKVRQPLLDPLSARECEVISLIADGFSNQQLADSLVISLNTAKRHVKHILAKLAVTNRTQAVARARELHLL